MDEAIAHAESAATDANAAANTATQATTGFLVLQEALTVIQDSLVNTYIPNITNVTTRAQTATNEANTAVSNVNSIVDSAEGLITTMEAAVSDWNMRKSNIDSLIIEMEEATSDTEAVTRKIDDMTVTSESISTGTASAEISEVDGHKNIHFRLRKGDPGASYIIKGHVYTTLSDLETDISDPVEGDQYNVGSTAPYNVYRWTGSNWEDQGAIGISVDQISDEDIDDIFNQNEVSDKAHKYLGIDGASYYTHSKLMPLINDKVDKVTGKGLSTNDFTDGYKTQVDTNRTSITVLNNNKVDKISGKGLSTNDFTTTYKNQVDTNKTDIASIKTGKLNSDFSAFSSISAGSVGNSSFVVNFNNNIYKVSGTQLISDIIELGAVITRYDVASASDTRTYLGIS